MTSTTNCTKCDSTQVVLQKRGYSTRNALIGFLIMAFLLAFIWKQIIDSQQFENAENYKLAVKFHWGYTPVDWVNNKAFWVGTVFLLAISFLAGMIGAQKNRIVCMNCLNKKQYSKGSIKATATIILVLISLSVFAQSRHTRHRKYSFNSAHRGEHHYNNTRSYHSRSSHRSRH